MIDATSLRALQIFQEESHPSKMGIGKVAVLLLFLSSCWS
jgi:hypothetical protein